MTKILYGYFCCFFVVAIYVNLFPLWDKLNMLLPASLLKAAPLTVLLLSLGFFGLIIHKKTRSPIRKEFLFTGAALALIIMLVPDPAFPAKRIHVPEYMALSLLTRYVMSQRVHGEKLLFFSVVFAILLGVHDELAQGLHPFRTFGIRDISVNALSCIAGGLIWHGAHLFKPSPLKDNTMNRTFPWPELCYIAWLLITVILAILPLQFFKGEQVPFWPFLPLLTTILYYSWIRKSFFTHHRHGISVINWTAIAIIIYPLLSFFGRFFFY